LAADSVEDVNREVDCDHLSYAIKAMIKSSMSLTIDGTWSVHQLFLHLQDIIGKYHQFFKGNMCHLQLENYVFFIDGNAMLLMFKHLFYYM
jgi:hypothetical protein